jgi:hypothetical protein
MKTSINDQFSLAALEGNRRVPKSAPALSDFMARLEKIHSHGVLKMSGAEVISRPRLAFKNLFCRPSGTSGRSSTRTQAYALG